jgi:hypothetical protein
MKTSKSIDPLSLLSLDGIEVRVKGFQLSGTFSISLATP